MGIRMKGEIWLYNFEDALKNVDIGVMTGTTDKYGYTKGFWLGEVDEFDVYLGNDRYTRLAPKVLGKW